MPRLFVAIDLPDATKDQLLSLREHDLPPGRWSRREALHLTLHFIGDVPEAVARAYQRVLGQVEVPAFDLRIRGVGQFPINDRPRVIWAGAQNTPDLRALHEAVGAALELEGFRRERRRFHPHITLMRFRKPIRRGPASRWLSAHKRFHRRALSRRAVRALRKRPAAERRRVQQARSLRSQSQIVDVGFAFGSPAKTAACRGEPLPATLLIIFGRLTESPLFTLPVLQAGVTA